MDGRTGEAGELLRRYVEWYGPDSVYVELQQNLLRGDTDRNRKLVGVAGKAGVPVVATNDVHYHLPERYRLQHALVAARLNTTIDQALPHLLPNHHLHLKSQAEMGRLFAECPEAVSNTLRVAERCVFDLSTDLGYTLPEPAVPKGYTPESYLRRLCYEAAARRYGVPVPRPRRGPASRGVPADRAPQPGGVPAALQGDRPPRPAHHGGTRAWSAPRRRWRRGPPDAGAARRWPCSSDT